MAFMGIPSHVAHTTQYVQASGNRLVGLVLLEIGDGAVTHIFRHHPAMLGNRGRTNLQECIDHFGDLLNREQVG